MKAIEVTQNGKRIILAGAPALADGTIHASVCLDDTSQDFAKIAVFGVTKFEEGKEQAMMTWKDGYRIAVSDEIRIRIIEVTEADIPDETRNPALDE